MINKTLYNLQQNHEAKKIANGIVDFLEQRDKNVHFRNFLLGNIPTLRKAMHENKDPNETLEKMKVSYDENMERIKKKAERIANINGEIVIAKEEQEKEKQDKERERKKKKKKKRKKKKVIQKVARSHIEAQKIVSVLTNYLKENNKNNDFRDFVLFNIDKVVKMKDQGLSPVETMFELEQLYNQKKNEEKIKEQEAINNGRFLVLMEEIEKEIEEEQKEKRKQRKLERKQRKKTRENFIRLAKEYNLKIRI